MKLLKNIVFAIVTTLAFVSTQAQANWMARGNNCYAYSEDGRYQIGISDRSLVVMGQFQCSAHYPMSDTVGINGRGYQALNICSPDMRLIPVISLANTDQAASAIASLKEARRARIRAFNETIIVNTDDIQACARSVAAVR